MTLDPWQEQALAGELPQLTAKALGLRGRACLHLGPGRALQIIQRRSRVLRKDTQASLLLLQEAQRRDPALQQLQVLILGAPLCSKARALWEEHGVEVLHRP